MTIFNTRRDNALRLIGTERGSLSQFAARMSMSKQQASHILGSKPIKHIGEDMARRIEQVYSLPIGSLDIRPQDIATPTDSIEAPLLQEIAGVPHLASYAFASRVTLSREWVRRNLAIAPEHVAIMPAIGDTMAPTIFDGDLCLVDRSATRIEAPGVYVIHFSAISVKFNARHFNDCHFNALKIVFALSDNFVGVLYAFGFK
jgi:SOS-response transcriptional repressor LexA